MNKAHHIPYPEGKSTSNQKSGKRSTRDRGDFTASRSELRARTEKEMERMNPQIMVRFDNTCTHVILLRFIPVAK